jgi:hypothetical protein
MDKIKQAIQLVIKYWPLIKKWGGQIMNIVKGIKKQEKKPPAMDSTQYLQWLTTEVARKEYVSVEDDPNTPQNERRTYCNFFVRSVCRLYGWSIFDESSQWDQAGEMCNYMETHPEQWKKLEGEVEYIDLQTKEKKKKVGPLYEEGSKWAAQGCLVIAGWKNPDWPKVVDAHVCVLISTTSISSPTTILIFSNKWGRLTSIAANVGSHNWIGKGLNEAFKSEPSLYLFLGI